MNRRQLLLASSTSLATVLAGCSGAESDDDGVAGSGVESGDDGDRTDDSPDADASEETQPVDEPDPLEFSGSGSDVVEIELEGGLTGVEAQHDGSSDFVVQLVDDGFPTFFIDARGQFEGASLEYAVAGEHELEIVADGDWEVTVTQPRSATGADPAVELSDSIPSYYGPFEFDGTYTMTGSHDGAGNFIVELRGQGRTDRELVINELGAYEGSTTFQYSGIGWIDVTTDGEWSIELE